MPRREQKPLDRMMVSLRLKKPQGGLTRDQAMAAWPVRNPSIKWQTNEEDLVVVELPRRKDWVGGLLGFLFYVPEAKPIQLDEVGTFVWSLCDGDHTVNDLVQELCREYKLNKREVEVSLTQYLQTLGKRGLVAFAIPREVAEAAGIKGQEVALSEEEGPAEEEEEA